MTKKKILIFSLAYYPKHIGGAEVAIKEITDRVDTDRYEFHLICNRFDTSLASVEQIGNVLVHRVGYARKDVEIKDTFGRLFYLAKVLYIPLAAYKALLLHRKYAYDGFWCMMLYMSYPVGLLRLVGIRRPYVLTLQEGDTFQHVFERWYIRLFKPLLLSGIRNATVIQSISKFLDHWVEQKGFSGTRIVVPNAVNIAHFTKEVSPNERNALRLNITSDRVAKVLITTSRLVRKNGIDTVIQALALLPSHIHFVIYGVGPEEQALRDLTASLALTDRVHFCGFLDHSVLPKHLKAADIFIRPSRSEGMGNSFVEAMAARVPVIATQAGGIADFLFDSSRNPDMPSTGVAVDIDSPEQIKEAVCRVLEDASGTEEMIENAYKLVLQKYNWDSVAKTMNREVFDRLFAKREDV